VTVSVGVALNEHGTDTPEVIMKRADVALYRAKREGRNRVVFDAA
jgi:two-component system cell cycle response regulator